jgi:hypothetical protein
MLLRVDVGMPAVAKRLIRALGGSEHVEPELEVRLLADEDACTSSDETQAILGPLRRSGSARLDTLVEDAAKSLYKSELARGGAHLDLGLLGARIFVPAVRRALDAGRGRLWEIQKIASRADAAPAR